MAEKPRVVVIGAGMAGLTAAHCLHAASAGDFFDLCVVEAGHRIGGRVLTSEFAGDRIEMGATWIHGIDGSPIHAVAADIGALAGSASVPWERMDGFPSDPLTVAEGGTVVDPLLVVDPIKSLYRGLRDSARGGDAPVESKHPGVGQFLRRGLREYRVSRGETRADVGGGWSLEDMEEAVFASHEFAERVCTSADELSDLDLAAEGEYRDYPGDHITIAHGYSRIIEHLAGALPPATILLGRRVRRIEWRLDGGPVKLHFDGGENPTMTADHVIVTVSLGVLKAGLGKEGGGDTSGLEFSPALPERKQEAIRRLGFGVVNKLFMEMGGADEARFPFLQMAFAPPTKEAKRAVPRWMRKTGSICPIYRGSRVLLAWLAGAEALELEALTDEEIISGVSATLGAFLPPTSSAAVERVKRSGWGSDPLFLGSYSYVAVGSSGDDLDEMAEPLAGARVSAGDPTPQILFAGEATHRAHYSTTHGAYLSGVREATRLLQHYRTCHSAATP
ncbi:polyamine oxidase 1 [Curcuma longa]|uniref:polyamine oxidase 1 n=1 Tax=Curcuma longa TaxID=136217 RepID=UPI003D9EB00B